METQIDFRVVDEGSVWLVYLESEAARNWVAENVEVPGWAWMGRHSFAADWRPARDLVQGMLNDGLAQG